MNKPRAPLPPIYRDIQRLLVHTEAVVRRFSRYHKYTVGTDMRRQAMLLMRGVHRACFDRAQQARHIEALVWAVDDFKLTLQLAKEVGAFADPSRSEASFAQFEATLNLVATIGKQCGGWHASSASRSHAPVGKQSTQGAAQAPGP